MGESSASRRRTVVAARYVRASIVLTVVPFATAGAVAHPTSATALAYAAWAWVLGAWAGQLHRIAARRWATGGDP